MWHKLQRTFSANPINLVSAEGSSLGQNLGSTELRFRISGQERIYSHKIEIIDNDGVPSILGVDLLKSVGAIHCSSLNTVTPLHGPLLDMILRPYRCTVQLLKSRALTLSQQLKGSSYGQVKK